MTNSAYSDRGAWKVQPFALPNDQMRTRLSPKGSIPVAGVGLKTGSGVAVGGGADVGVGVGTGTSDSLTTTNEVDDVSPAAVT